MEGRNRLSVVGHARHMPSCRLRCRHIGLRSAPGVAILSRSRLDGQTSAVPTRSATCRCHWHAPCNSFAGEREINDYRTGDGWSFPVDGDPADRRHVSDGPTPRTPHFARPRAARGRGGRVGRALARDAPFRASPMCRSLASAPILRRRETSARRIFLAAGDAGSVFTFPISADARTFTAPGAAMAVKQSRPRRSPLNRHASCFTFRLVSETPEFRTCPTQSLATERRAARGRRAQMFSLRWVRSALLASERIRP